VFEELLTEREKIAKSHVFAGVCDPGDMDVPLAVVFDVTATSGCPGSKLHSYTAALTEFAPFTTPMSNVTVKFGDPALLRIRPLAMQVNAPGGVGLAAFTSIV